MVREYHRELLTASNSEIGRVIKSLAIADEEYRQALQAFAQQRAAKFG